MNTFSSVSGVRKLSASTNEDILSQQETVIKKVTPVRQSALDGTGGIKGKHIAQRSASDWINYGDPADWDREFEIAVLTAVERIKKGSLDSRNIIKYFQEIRFQIACKRENVFAEQFGLRRDCHEQEMMLLHYTKIYRTNPAYGYALERAVIIPYDGKYFVELKNDVGKNWSVFNYYGRGAKGRLRYGLVQGYINDKPTPLTQYVFCPKQEQRCEESEAWFSKGDENYIGENKESGIWLHTGTEQIPFVLKHIESLIDKAIVTDDLSVIPSIHWWYVHLAPTCRGSGGTAEMITNTLCRLHSVDLPPWKEGVAPSIETLLEPNEKKYCENYHELFSSDQEKLKELFKKPDY